MNRRVPPVAFVAVLVMAAGEGVSAQGDLFEKSQELLKQYGGNLSGADELSIGEIAAGLKDALRVGTKRVARQLGATDGFNGDPAVHIPLPDSMATVQSALGALGMSSMLDDLELRLNRAAEAAAPKARKVFWQAIKEMTLEDVKGVYNGPDDAATRYFQSKMSAPLATEMTPIVNKSLAQVGAVQAYDEVIGQYREIPFVPDAKADLSEYVVERGMDGIFHYLAIEEAAIRRNPTKRTTELQNPQSPS